MISAEPVDLRRRWLVITLATVVMQFAYWPILFARGAAEDVSSAVSGGMVAFGVALVPFVFMALAFGSRHPRAPSAVLKAMGLSLLVGLPTIVILNVAVGVAAGFAAGGVVALARDPELHPLRLRWWAVIGMTVYLFALVLTVPDFAIMSGAVLPFTVLGLVDQAAETR